MPQNPFSRCAPFQVAFIITGMLTGLDATEISEGAELSRQAVNRNLKSIRQILFTHNNFYTMCVAPMLFIPPGHFTKKNIEFLAFCITDAISSDDDILSKIHYCVKECPAFDYSASEFRELISEDLDGPIFGREYKDFIYKVEKVFSTIAKKKYCKSCPRNTKFDYLDYLCTNPHTFIDFHIYFAKK